MGQLGLSDLEIAGFRPRRKLFELGLGLDELGLGRAQIGGRHAALSLAELPASTLVHRQVPCPWALKGTVMRVMTERLRDRNVDLLDGIKVFDERGWAQLLPDPDEPLVHIYAEGATEQASGELEAELRGMVEAIMESEGAAAAAGASS